MREIAHAQKRNPLSDLDEILQGEILHQHPPPRAKPALAGGSANGFAGGRWQFSCNVIGTKGGELGDQAVMICKVGGSSTAACNMCARSLSPRQKQIHVANVRSVRPFIIISKLSICLCVSFLFSLCMLPIR